MKRLIFKVFLGILIFSISEANEIGKILKYRGNVVIFRENITKPLSVNKHKYPLFVKDIVNTKSKSLAFIGFIDGSKVLLKEKSSLLIDGYRKFSINKGRVLFKIKRRGHLRGAIVKVKSIVIGVKGTKFLVDYSNTRTAIYLKKGLISVKNLSGEFKVYKKKQEEEFEAFKKEFEEGVKKQAEEFEEYKKQIQKEFVEYVREFELKAGNAVYIEGNEVRSLKITPEIEEEFKLLDRLDEEI